VGNRKRRSGCPQVFEADFAEILHATQRVADQNEETVRIIGARKATAREEEDYAKIR